MDKWISYLDLVFENPNSQKISLHILLYPMYPCISLSYPFISWGANSQKMESRAAAAAPHNPFPALIASRVYVYVSVCICMYCMYLYAQSYRSNMYLYVLYVLAQTTTDAIKTSTKDTPLGRLPAGPTEILHGQAPNHLFQPSGAQPLTRFGAPAHLVHVGEKGGE